VTLTGTNTIALYGRRTNVFFIGSNGYITLDSGDTSYTESLATHFALPRVAPLLHDLNPPAGGTISWKQLLDRVVVTYQDIQDLGGPGSGNNFQIEMFANGRIMITYLALHAATALAGLSAGQGVPSDFAESDLSAHSAGPLVSPGIISQSSNQSVLPGRSATFAVITSGSAPLNYRWRKNAVSLTDGANIAGASTATLNLSNLTESDSGSYTVLVTNNAGSVISSSAILLVSSIDHFTWSHIPWPQAVDVPFLVTIEAQDVGNGTVSNYNNVVNLSIIGGGVGIRPVLISNFVDGVWTGAVMVAQSGTNLVLQASDRFGHGGQSEPITVINAPVLTMATSGNFLILSWPAGAPALVVESTPTLSPPAWAPFGQPVVIGDNYVLPVDMSDPQGFFRLHYTPP